MTTRSRWHRLSVRILVTLTVLLLLAAAVTAALQVRGRRQDERALAAAAYGTAIYQIQMPLGKPLADVQTELAILNRNTVVRGNEILIVTQEGRSVWHCRHHFFGTAMHFEGGKLTQIRTDEWLDTCS